jgi:hypothetical protein
MTQRKKKIQKTVRLPDNLQEALESGFVLGGGEYRESNDKLTCRGRYSLARERKGENASDELLVVPFVAKYKFGRPRLPRPEERYL